MKENNIKQNTKDIIKEPNQSRLKQFLINTLVIFFILFEEILWRRIAKPIFDEVKELEISKKAKIKLISIQNKYIILVLFLIPLIVMETFAYGAGLALINGYILLFLILYFFKGLAMLPMLFVFDIKKEILLEFSLIKKSYDFLLWFLDSKPFRIGKINIKKFKKSFRKKLDLLKKSMGGSHSPLLQKIASKISCLRNCILK
jgi:hypothetical protein